MKEALLSIIKDENRIITGQIDPQYLSDNLGRKKGTAEAVAFSGIHRGNQRGYALCLEK